MVLDENNGDVHNVQATQYDPMGGDFGKELSQAEAMQKLVHATRQLHVQSPVADRDPAAKPKKKKNKKKKSMKPPTADYEATREQLLRPSSVSSPPPCDLAETYANTLVRGAKFIKFGRLGKPRSKWIIVNMEGTIFWSNVDEAKTVSSIKLVEVKNVFKGKKTPVFARKVAAEIPDDCCLSIVTADRSLDLQAESSEVRDLWVDALRYGAENVQMLGRVARETVKTTEQEMKEREMEEKLRELSDQLDTSKKLIIAKNKEIIEREQQLIQERRNIKTELSKKDEELSQKQDELIRLQKQQQELQTQLKKVHHERAASRSLKTNELEQARRELKLMEKKLTTTVKSSEEDKAQMLQMLEESQDLLSKTKDSLHRRQQSRADKLAVIEAMRQERDEMKDKNLALRKELAKAQQIREQTERDQRRVKTMLAALVTKLDAAGVKVEIEPEVTQVAAEVVTEEAIPAAPAVAPPAPPVTETEAPTLAVVPEAPAIEVPAPERKAPQSAAPVQASADCVCVDEAHWQPDSASSCCMRCQSDFTFFNRRHHCRKCGELVCDDCSKTKLHLPKYTDKVRVCIGCAPSVPLMRNSPAIRRNSPKVTRRS